MKTVHLAERYFHIISETVREEYPAGSTADVSDDRAKAMQDAGVLKGDPVDVVEAPPAEKKPAKA